MARTAKSTKSSSRQRMTAPQLESFRTIVGNRDLRLGFLIHDVSRLRRLAFDQLMKPIGVTRSQWWLLAYLSRHDGMKQTQLAKLLDVGRVSLGGLVDRLEKSRYVVRVSDPNDRRAKRVFLTDTAQRLLDEMRGAEDDMNARILRGVNAKSRALLLDLLIQIKQNLAGVTVATAETEAVAD